MSEIVVTALRVGFLALMWVFILFAANVVRTDMFGRSVSAASTELRTPTAPAPVRRSRRGDPTRLRVTEGRNTGAEVPLIGDVTIGRAHDATLTIDDDYASTHHATISQNASGRWQVDDHTSTNGTYVNDVRITQPTPITPKDDVRIGRTHLRLEK